MAETKRFELYNNICTIDTCRTAFSRFSVLATTAVILNAVLLLILPGELIAVTAVCCVALAGLVTVRLEHSLYVAFFYLTFAGMIKILSGYHPLMHVSSDIFLVLFLFRSLSDVNTNGFSKVYLTPTFPFIAVFVCWVLLQFLNPLGLGVLPSIAGLKVYLIPMIVCLLACHHMNDTAAERFTQILVILGAVMATAAFIEYVFFKNFLFNLHGGYVRAAKLDRFAGAFYRPFGFTEIPGKPSLFLAMIAPFATYQLLSRHPLSTLRIKLTCLYFIAVSIPVLIFCQTRVTMLQFLLLSLMVLAYDPKKILGRFFGAAVVGFLIIGGLLYFVAPKVMGSSGVSAGQIYVLEKRLSTLAQAETYTKSRHGATDRMALLAENYGVMGLGLSRTGAAAGYWSGRIRNHPYVDSSWAFADNLYYALMAEIGLVGLLSWLAMMGAIIYTTFKNAISGLRKGGRPKPRGFLAWTCGCLIVVILLSGMGSEGVLYNPVVAFLWAAAGLGLRKVTHAS